jgi:hypothetical protein
MSCKPQLLLLAAVLAAPLPALAWGPKGHQIVADLAARRLQPEARSEVARLLAGEPASTDGQAPTLASIANWADDRRASETGPVRTGRRHYINFNGPECAYVPPADCPDGQCEVVGAINRNLQMLADRRRPDAERLEALKFLVHFVGDVHQPLHASPLRDRGGNDYQLNYRGKVSAPEATEPGTNLHAVWDSLILQRARLSADAYADYLDRQPPLPPDQSWQSDRPAVAWAVESCRIVADGDIYPPGHVIDDHYLDAHRLQAEARLRQAGARLAAMLNSALAPSTRP